MAVGAGGLLAALGAARAVARLARRQTVVGNLLGAASGRLLQGDENGSAHVATVKTHATTRRSRAPEEGAEQVGHVEAAAKDVAHVGAALAVAVDRAVAIVERALFGVGQDRVGLVDLLEANLGIGSLVDVGVHGAGLLVESLANRRVVCVSVNTEDRVVVFGISHEKASSTITKSERVPYKQT